MYFASAETKKSTSLHPWMVMQLGSYWSEKLHFLLLQLIYWQIIIIKKTSKNVKGLKD
jgi:hypothetical protein